MKLSKIAQAIIMATAGSMFLVQASPAESEASGSGQTSTESSGIELLPPDGSGTEFFTREQEEEILKHRKKGRVIYSEVRIGQPNEKITKQFLDEHDYHPDSSGKDYHPVLVTGKEDWRPDPLPASQDSQNDKKPAQKPAEKPAEQPAEKSVEQPVEKPAEKPAEQPVENPAEKPVEQPVGKPAEKPAEQPVEKPAEKSAEQPVEKPAEKPAEQPVEKPAEKPVEQPVEKPAEKPAEQPVEKPAEKPAEQPVEKPAEKPVEKPAEKPAEQPVEKPAEKPVEKPAEKPAEQPVDKPAEKPAEQPVEKPAEKPAEQPVEKPAEKPVEQPAEKPAEKPPAKPAEKPAGKPDAKQAAGSENHPAPRQNNPVFPARDGKIFGMEADQFSVEILKQEVVAPQKDLPSDAVVRASSSVADDYEKPDPDAGENGEDDSSESGEDPNAIEDKPQDSDWEADLSGNIPENGSQTFTPNAVPENVPDSGISPETAGNDEAGAGSPERESSSEPDENVSEKASGTSGVLSAPAGDSSEPPAGSGDTETKDGTPDAAVPPQSPAPASDSLPEKPATIAESELVAKFPLPPEPVKGKCPAAPARKSDATVTVGPGQGFSSVLNQIMTPEVQAAGVTRKMAGAALFRRNFSSFSHVTPVFPFADSELRVPGTAEMLNEDPATMDYLNAAEGHRITRDSIPPTLSDKACQDAEKVYDSAKSEWEKQVSEVKTARKRYLEENNLTLE